MTNGMHKNDQHPWRKIIIGYVVTAAVVMAAVFFLAKNQVSHETNDRLDQIRQTQIGNCHVAVKSRAAQRQAFIDELTAAFAQNGTFQLHHDPQHPEFDAIIDEINMQLTANPQTPAQRQATRDAIIDQTLRNLPALRCGPNGERIPVTTTTLPAPENR